MSKMVDIVVENVGGLVGKHRFSLQEGLNTVNAPNAIGKTSFLKAIELLGLQNKDLKGKGHYANFFADGSVSIKTTGDIVCDRKFRKIGSKDMAEAGGEPLIETGKDYISSICFVTPENLLINRMLEGGPIKSYINRFSDSEYYDVVAEELSKINQDAKSKLSMYREDVTKAEETRKTIRILNEDRKEIEKKLKEMPEIDENMLFKDYERFQGKKAEKEGIAKERIDAKDALEKNVSDIGDKKDEIKNCENDIKDIKKKYPKMEKRLGEFVSEIRKVTKQMEKITRQKIIADDTLKMIRENWTNRLKFKNEEGVCYACGKPLTEQELKKWENKIMTKLEDLNKAHKITSRELQDLKDERHDLDIKQGYLAEREQLLEGSQHILAACESRKFSLEKKVKRLTRKEKKIQEEIESLSKSADAFEQYREKDNLDTLLHEKEKTIETAEARLKDLQKKTINLDKLQNKIDFLEHAEPYIRARREEIVDAVRVRFNDAINDIYRKMGFKDFEDITITPDYAVNVTKKAKGKEIENFPLNALASSERVTLGIVLLMVAKQEYLPTFPFFVIDEVITAYDPTRFEKIKKYVKKTTDYVIITQLSDEEGIVIQHES